MNLEFLSFNELKIKVSEYYRRNVGNAETTHFIKNNHLEVFTVVDGVYAGRFENVLTEKLVKEIFQEINYVELFQDKHLNSLMFGDVDKVSIASFKKIYGIDSNGDGFITLPNDIHERMFVQEQLNDEEKDFPLFVNELEKYYEQSEVSISITRNNMCISKDALEILLGEPIISIEEDFDDCAVLEGNEKSQRDARDKRGMARIIAKYVESQQSGEYKAVDIADKVIEIMNEFNAKQTQRTDYMKTWIGGVIDSKARTAGVRKLKKD